MVAEGYPHDISPQAGAHEFADALADAAVDARADALVVVFAPPLPGQLPDEDADFAAALASVALAGEKPTVATFLLGNLPARVPHFARIAKLLGEDVSGCDELAAAHRAIAAVERLNKAIGIPSKLREFGAREDQIPVFAEKAFGIKRILRVNPRSVTIEDLKSILMSAL